MGHSERLGARVIVSDVYGRSNNSIIGSPEAGMAVIR